MKQQVLLQKDPSGAELALQEYKDALLDVATGSGGGGVTQFLLRQEVAERSAVFSATS